MRISAHGGDVPRARPVCRPVTSDHLRFAARRMAVTIATALNAGLQAHRSGQLEQAISVYGAVLDLSPGHATAHHLRGFALLQNGHHADALSDLQSAVQASADNANAWSHLSVCLDRLGKPAAQAAQRALLLQPATQEALDVLLRERTRDDAGGDRCLPWLLAVAPGHSAVWSRAGQTRARSAPSQARSDLRRALCLTPTDPAVGLDLADLERHAHRPDSARVLADRMLRLRPSDPRALSERAAAATELDAIPSALADTRRAALLDPGHTTAWGNHAEALYRLADYARASLFGERAHLTAPADASVRANLAAYRLAAGDLATGWPLFRSRPARRHTRGPDLPRWSGEGGADLLVLAEQGLGDELLFSTLWHDLNRFVSERRLAAATVEADERLIALGSRSHPLLSWRRRLQADDTGGPFTHWCLAGDLPEFLRPGIDSFEAAVPGLTPESERVVQWRNWLDQATGGRPAVGLCWRSGSRAGHRRRHYPKIEDCGPLLALENRLFVVLQYDDCLEEIEDLALGPGSDIVLPPGLDRRTDQDGVAALMAALDLVVSADTAVLALAGAVAVPTIGFSLHPGWVGLGETRHPWFPQVQRVHRPPEVSWRETMETVARQAEDTLGNRR